MADVPPSKPPPKPIPRQQSDPRIAEKLAEAQRKMREASEAAAKAARLVLGESLVPDGYEIGDDTPTPDRREATFPRRLADVANSLVPTKWLGLLFMFLLGVAGGLVAVGVVWGQTVTENRTGVAAAKADAAEALQKATPVGELKGKLDLTIKKTDETAAKVDKLADDTADVKKDVAVIQTQQKAMNDKLVDIAADLKTLVRAAKK